MSAPTFVTLTINDILIGCPINPAYCKTFYPTKCSKGPAIGFDMVDGQKLYWNFWDPMFAEDKREKIRDGVLKTLYKDVKIWGTIRSICWQIAPLEIEPQPYPHDPNPLRDEPVNQYRKEY